MTGVPPSGAGHSAEPEPISVVSAETASVPNAICAYPIPGWRLDHILWDERQGHPDGWIVSLKRERPSMRLDQREYVVMARSDVGPLEAWDEALQIALRSDKREAARAAPQDDAQ